MLWAASAAAQPARGDADGAPPSYEQSVQRALREFELANYAEARAMLLSAHELYPNARTLRALGMVEYDAGVNYTEPGATRVARVMTMHGPSNSDVVILNFATLSLDLCRATRATGAIAIDCEHTAGHCGAPALLQEAAWRFMKDHPYGLASEPYASGLPPDFPSYCRITTN